MNAFSDALDGLGAPLRALVVAVVGAGLAWAWFEGSWPVPTCAALVVLLAGAGLDELGQRTSLEHPRRAMRLMQWWIIMPMILAALAAAVSIVLAVELAVPDSAPDATKETVGALATAVTAFLSAGFIDWASDSKDSRVSDRIRDNFHSRYKGKFKPGTAGQNYVYAQHVEGVEGWGSSARRKRADGIAARWTTDRS